MSFLNWTQELDLGIAVIDEQHKHIADYINDLHKAIETTIENRSFLLQRAL